MNVAIHLHASPRKAPAHEQKLRSACLWKALDRWSRCCRAALALQLECMPLAARRLVASERARIETAAAALLKSGTLTGEEITVLLNGATASWVR